MKPKTQVWKLLTTLLYGEYGWLRRAPLGHITVPIRELAQQLGRRPENLHEDVAYLFTLGLMEDIDWRSHYFTAKLKCPVDTNWKTK
jgi:hypothetical protein